MPLIIDELVTEVVVEDAGASGEAPTLDPEALRALILEILRSEIERHERLGEGR